MDSSKMTPNPPLRPIRSFVRREGKGARARAAILQAYGATYSLSVSDDTGHPINPEAIFGRIAPLVLEIGFGRGETLFQMAAQAPEKDFIGIEVYRTGISQLIAKSQRAGLQNLRVFEGDARTVLNRCIPDAALSTVQIFFPDPWPKRKHFKRRLIQTDFIELIALKLRPGGRLHLATDWADYAAQMMDLLSGSPLLKNTVGPGCYAPRPIDRPFSKYEARGLGLGHQTWDLILERPL